MMTRSVKGTESPKSAPSLPSVPEMNSQPSGDLVSGASSATTSVIHQTPWDRARLAKLPASKQHQITRAITYHIIDDMRPFSTVSSPSFRNILHVCEHRYRPPSAATMSEQIIPALYEVEKAKLLKDLEAANYIAITTDGWTSRAVQAYETITVHYMKDWELCSKVLQTNLLPESHTGEVLAAELDQAICSWGLKGKVIAVTTDNASNMTKACSLSKECGVHIGCFAHVINLAAQNANKTMQDASKAINPVITFFRKSSTVGVPVLEEMQKRLGLPQHQLITEVKTRWNSGYLSRQRFLEQRPAIVSAFLDPRLSKQKEAKLMNAQLDEDVINSLEVYMELMKHMYNATLEISAEKSPTCGLVLPLLDKLIKEFTIKDEDAGSTEKIKKAVHDDLIKRYNQPEVRKFLEEAAALDPRMKQRKCIPQETWDRITSCVELLLQKNQEKKVTCNVKQEPGLVQEPDVDQEMSNGAEPPPKKQKLDSLLDDDDDDDEPIVLQQYQITFAQMAQQEVNKYRQMPKVPIGDSPIKFWKDNQYILPCLSNIAEKYLVAQATSVASERVFSTAGDIVTAERACLEPGAVDKMIFLKKNLDGPIN